MKISFELELSQKEINALYTEFEITESEGLIVNGVDLTLIIGKLKEQLANYSPLS